MLGVIASYEERNRTERGAIRSDMDVIMKRVTTNHHNQNRRFDKLTDQFGDMMNQLSNFGNQFNVVSKQLVELTRVKPNVPSPVVSSHSTESSEESGDFLRGRANFIDRPFGESEDDPSVATPRVKSELDPRAPSFVTERKRPVSVPYEAT